MTMIELLVMSILVTLCFMSFAAMKKGSTNMKKPSRIKSFSTTMPIDKAMKTVIQFAQSSGYKIDDFNETKAIIILSDSASLASYGNFYPVYFKKRSNESLLIEVGIKSKVTTQLFGFDTPHAKCFNGIKTVIYAAF